MASSNRKQRRSVGLDLGGTKIFGVACDGQTVVDEAKVPTPTGGVDEIVDALVDMARSLGGDDLEVVGVGTPGVVEPGTGRVLRAPNLEGFEQPVELGAVLRAGIGVPVAVANDVNAAAFGEASAGAAKGFGDVLAVWLGTGVGGGLILDGALRVGKGGLAGEIGHMISVPDGRVCGCGGAGHLESYMGRAGLVAELRRQVVDGVDSSLAPYVDDVKIKSKVWRKAYADGDPLAVALVDEGIGHLTTAVANLSVSVELEAIVIGGGIGERFFDVVGPRLRAGLEKLLFAGTVPEVVEATLGDHSGALGAATLALSAT